MLDNDKETNIPYPLKQLLKDVFQFFLKLLKIVWGYTKKHHLAIIEIIIATIAAFIGYIVLSNQYKEKEISRIPYFSYSFSKEINKFIVTGGENFYVKEVKWYMPETRGDYPVRITGDHPVFLDPVYIKRNLVIDLIIFNKESSSNDRAKEIMRCLIIPNISDEGLPLLAQTTYIYKGDTVSTSTIDLLLLKRFDTGLPSMDAIERNASKEKGQEFISYGQSILKKIFSSDITKNSNWILPNGDCGLIFNDIHPIDWTDF